MGVPGLFVYLQKRFRNAIVHFPRGKRSFQFNNVYLDANGLLHGAAQKVFNYGESKRKIDPYSHLSTEEKIVEVYKQFFENIKEVTTMIKPTSILYIAIDGPAPKAKQAQQRERRFVAAHLRPPGTNFDSSSITPGTEFMHGLSSYMFYRIREYIQRSSEWRGIQVIFSPPTVEGEGEHKILDLIRSLPASAKNNESHCMFGPDGDLLILTLSVHIRRMFLFREDQYNPGWMDLVNMSVIRSGLGQAIYSHHLLRGKRNYDDVSNDFALIGFFVGNDFLPKIKMFYKLEDGLEKMIDTYAKLSHDPIAKGDKFLTKGVFIQKAAFEAFLEELASHEERYIASQATVVAPEQRFVDKTLLKFSIISEGKVVSIDFDKYRVAYYEKCGFDGSSRSFEKNVTLLAKDYLRTFVWVYLYYVKGIQSWQTAYSYHYPPLMVDLVATLKKMSYQEFVALGAFNKSIPSSPFVQLLCVLPPASAKLLPEHYRTLFTEGALVDAGFYPDTFEVDYEGKYKEHQGVALLPFIDRCKVEEEYDKLEATDPYFYHRNRRGSAYIFGWSYGAYSSTFKSKYGSIDPCNVIVEKLKESET